MNNIVKIFKGDLQKVRRNLVAWAVIIGLLVVPCLYSWFNINASWDPYGNTGKLKIAIANSDAGYSGELLDLAVNYGDNLVTGVAVTDTFDWIVTDENDAIEGTKSGEYYAAIVIPEDFSSNMVSVYADETKKAELIYYVNEKENAIASIITLKGAKGISQQVADALISSVMEYALTTTKNRLEGTSEESARELLTNVDTIVLHVESILNNAHDTVASLHSATSSMDDMLKSTSDLAAVLEETAGEGQGLSKEISSNVKALMKTVDDDINALETFLEAIQATELVNVQKLIDKVKTLQADLRTLKQNLKDVNSTSGTTLKQLKKVAGNIQTLSAETRSNLKSLANALTDTESALSSSSSRMAELSEKLEEAIKTGDTEVLKNIFKQDATELSAFLTSPVQLKRHAVYHVENYGSSMAPFYTALAIWVGATLLVALMEVTLTEARRKELDNLKNYQSYLGRYIIFGIIAVFQSLLICLGDICYLGIQCQHPVLFIIAGTFASIVFSSIVYSLAVSFGNIGKAVAVIFMVIQVAGSGGTFPIETAPEFFQKVYPLLPFPHLMNAMRETIAGMYGNTYWIELGKLSLFLLGALLLGLVLRRPLIRLNTAFNEKLKDTHLM